MKTSAKFYTITSKYDTMLTMDDVSTSDEQVDKLCREFNIHCRSCIGSLIYLLYTRVDVSFVVHKLEKFSSNLGKVNYEGLVHMLIYIKKYKTFGLKYYAGMNDAFVSGLLRQTNIKTENQLMKFSNSSCQDCTKLAEVQDYTLSFMKVVQLTISHMLQYHLLNQVHKVSTIKHVLQEWLYHISGCSFMSC